MDTVTELSRAKLNLSLDVLAKRADGYHDLRMVMGSVAFGDEVTVSLRTDGETVCRSDLPWLPTDRRNLAVRAAEAFFAAVGEAYPGTEIRMVKHVPVGAGMAGGSANAAAVLRALNTLTASGLDADTLRRIGLEIGSDVPYCVAGGMALAEGRGERLTPLPPLPECHIVICKPAFSISTAELFSRIDSRAVRTHPDTAGLIGAMERGDLGGTAVRMYNVFEDVLPRNAGAVRSIRSALRDAGALGAVMTGTGSAVFGLFDSLPRAEAARDRLSGAYRDCFLTAMESDQYF